MADSSSLKVELREISGKGGARATRKRGLVPGIIYGDNQDPILIEIDPRTLVSEMNKAGFASQIFEIELNDQKHRTMAQEVQMHEVLDTPIHVDFRRIGIETMVNVDITVNFINDEDSPGIKRGGVLNVVRHEVEVRAKPDNLPRFLEVDLSGSDIGDSIHISSISLPDGVTPTITDRDFTICTIASPTVIATETTEEESETEEGAETEDTDSEDQDKEEAK